MKRLAGSTVSRFMDRLFMFEDVSIIHKAVVNLRGEHVTLAATFRTLNSKATLPYWMDDGFNFLEKVENNKGWTMNKGRRAQIGIALELMGEIVWQLLLFAKAMSRLIYLTG